jgi:predicted ArsR family transcriptional regulator
MNGESLDDRLAGLAALAEPVRRRLYSYVVAEPEPVSRDRAAEGIGVARHVAKFHLDRLVTDGLLDVEYRRPPGRRGPGAGRPTKLYRRSARQLAVSVPERRYELVGRFLAGAITEADRTSTTLPEAISAAAHTAGLELGREARRRAGPRAGRSALLAAGGEALQGQGYEPRIDPSGLTLANCPFEALAKDYTELVCGLNLEFMQGLLTGLDLPKITARLDPAPGQCCVRLATG